MWTRSVTGELQVVLVKCSNFSAQKYGMRVSQRKGCDVELGSANSNVECIGRAHRPSAVNR